MAPNFSTIVAFGRALRSGETSALATVDACLESIATRDPDINAFITVLADEARAAAAKADRALQDGHDLGPLHGVPISLKDLFDALGVATTAASRVRAEHVATEDAEVVARLRAGGAVFVGKTNLHEFALGTTNEDSAYGPVKHPLDPTRSPGGSSGGSAASVLAGMAVASIGTDTGGSIRIPSAACGLVGLKPAFGEIPLHGVVPLSHTMDHVGSLCRSVDDTIILHQALCGAPAGPSGPSRTSHQLRLGVPRSYFFDVLDDAVAETFESACDRLRADGVTLVPVTIEHASQIPAIYLHIVLAEAAVLHASTLDSRPEDYTEPVRLRLETGRYVLAEDYLRALRGRDVLCAEVDTILETCDALLLPTLPVPATLLGADTVQVGGTSESVRAITLRLTQLFNLTGHAAITLPCGRTGAALPVGAQLASRGPSAARLLPVAKQLESILLG